MGVSQQTISKIEQSESVKEDTPGKIAKALGITPHAIKGFGEDAIINYFYDQNYFHYQCTFNPLNKVMELYEQLFQAERVTLYLYQNNGYLMYLNMIFGEKLTVLRKQLKWSQDNLAKKIGRSAPIVGWIERYEITHSIDVAVWSLRLPMP